MDHLPKLKHLLLIIILLLQPCIAMAGISVLGGLSHIKTVQSGETYTGMILLRNNDAEAKEVKLYQTDYLFFSDGTNQYGAPGEIERSNADWITFSPHRLTIQPNSLGEIKYQIKIPDDTSLNGTYWSMIMVEGIPKNSPESETAPKKENTIGVSTLMRYGIQMITSIGATGEKKLKFQNTSLVRGEEKKRELLVDVENIGQVWLRPTLWVELYTEEGSYVGRFDGGQLRTFPGTSVRFSVDLSQVPTETYQALVVADCGGEDVYGVTYKLQCK